MADLEAVLREAAKAIGIAQLKTEQKDVIMAVSYTHLRAHETLRYLVCRLLLEKKN